MVGSFFYYVFYFIDPKFGGNVELQNKLGYHHAWNRHVWIQGIQLTMILKALVASRIRHAWPDGCMGQIDATWQVGLQMSQEPCIH